MLTNTTKIITTLAVACAASFAAMPAQAGTASVSVNIDRADLMSEAGTARIYYRLQQTAENACQANEGRVSLKQKVAAEACAERLMDGFVAQLRSQRMSALHSEAKTNAG